MKSTGYILNGVYYSGAVDSRDFVDGHASTDKEYSHDRQREEHRRDLIQPYQRDGSPNPEFVAQYPEESQTYGFL